MKIVHFFSIRAKFGGDANQQTLGMTLGAFVFALIVFLFRMPTLTWQIFLIGFI
ncbi:GRP family sugar transporter, partial [Leuconostoc lactis]|uniref:GRP family sugar transporter n=1 Tax=Leuconostoc lactis TaxID=1246 RepID=UPI003B980B61